MLPWLLLFKAFAAKYAPKTIRVPLKTNVSAHAELNDVAKNIESATSKKISNILLKNLF
jgi:hypothetical protein